MTLEAAYEDWLRHLTAEKGLSTKTVEAYTADVKAFLDFAGRGGADCAGLDRMLHDRYFESLAPCAGSTTARRRSSLKSFLAYGEQEGWVDPPFTETLETWHFRSAVPDYLTEAEIRRLLEGAAREDGPHAERDRLALRLMVFLGLRVGEVCALKVSDVDGSEALLRVEGKGSRVRLMPLPPWLRDELVGWVRLGRGASRGPALFPAASGGFPTRQEIWRFVKRLAASVGIRRRVHPHILRHSFATQLLGSGAGLRAVQDLLGHADVRTTERYTHVAPERLRGVVEACHPLQGAGALQTSKKPGNGPY